MIPRTDCWPVIRPVFFRGRLPGRRERPAWPPRSRRRVWYNLATRIRGLIFLAALIEASSSRSDEYVTSHR